LLEISPEQGLRAAPAALRNPPETLAVDLDLHRLGAETGHRLIELFLTHDSQRVRRTGLTQLGALGTDALPIMRKLVAESTTPTDVRTELAYLLATVADPVDKPLFERLVRQETDNDIGLRAAWALARFGGADLEATFRGHLAMKNPKIRAVAAYGLARSQ
jgi:HEAT repeat protein